MTPEDAPTVTVVIVSWNTRELLAACLDSVRRNTSDVDALDVIVIDNASSDDSVAMITEQYPEVELIANVENRGFALANNQGIDRARGEYVLLLNSDAELTSGALAQLVATLRNQPKVGAVGPRLEYADGRFQRWTAGQAPSLSSACSYLLFLDRLPGGVRRRGLYLERDVVEKRTVEWVSAACALVRRSVLSVTGGFDASYFYMEDVDLCVRIGDAGFEVVYEPSAKVVHHMGGSTAAAIGSPEAFRSFHRYMASRVSVPAMLGVRGAEVVGYSARFLTHGALAASPRRRQRQWTMARKSAQGLRYSLQPAPVVAPAFASSRVAA